MSLNVLCDQTTPRPQLHPRFASLYVDGVATVGSLTDLGGSLKSIKAMSGVTAAQSLAVADSGKIVTVPQPTANIVISLPAVAASAGVTYKIILTAVGDTTHTCTIQTAASENKFLGNIGPMGLNPGAANTYATTSYTTLVISTAHHNIVWGANGSVGDFIDLTCDGNYWYVSGNSGVAGTWTSAA